MSEISPEPVLSRNDPLRLLQRRFVWGMFAVAVLAMLNQVVLQPWLIRLTTDAPIINVAGRQRMLSQKLSKAALSLRTADPRERVASLQSLQELEIALADWSQAHRGLQYGDAELGIPANSDPEIEFAFHELEPHFSKMHGAAADLIVHHDDEGIRHEATARMLSEEREYLPRMHAIVGMFEAESRARVTSLRRAGWVILGLILILLASLARFALRPVLRLIEQRVAERTRRLSEMNEQLAREIGERKLAEQRTRELLEQLAHASRLNSLGQMAAGLAHELNQPLGAIVNYAEAAQCHLESSEISRDEAQSALRRISAASLRAGAIVHRLRNFIRREASTCEPVLIPELIKEVIELCRPEGRKRDVSIVFERTDSQLPRVSLDAIQIQQVLVNLIHNAMQAMELNPPEDRIVRIALRRESDDEVRIDVIDRGHGFAEQGAEDLFSPFYTTRPEGLGMGLAICRSIVQQHGGRFWAVSPHLGGAVFSLTLPLTAQPHEPADCVHC